MAATSTSFPPYTYGQQAPDFRMTSTNSSSAMAVWLFLVTNPEFLNALSSNNNTTQSLPIDDIAQATNLTSECVQEIFDQFAKNPDPVKKAAFYTVAGEFQGYSNNAGYQRTNCPMDALPILALCGKCAEIDPAGTP